MTGLPDGWGIRALGDIADIVRGVTYKKSDAKSAPDRGYSPLLRATNIGSSLNLGGELVYVPTTGVNAQQFLRCGDIVLASSSGSLSVVGKNARLLADWDGTFGAFCAAIRSRPEVDSGYLALYLSSDSVRRRWSEAARGTNINNLKKSDLAPTPVPLPPLDEQRRIVAILEDHLSRLDAGASSVEAATRRLIALRRSALNVLFSGADYPRVPLRELVVGIEAGRSFGGFSHAASDDEWGIIKVSAMTWGTFRANENKAIASDRADARYEINEGDLLISRANTTAYVGASVLVGEVRPRLLLSDKSLRILAAPGVEREWLWRALSAPDARSQMSAAATGTKDSMRNISQPALLNIELSAVPVADQKAAVAISLEVETGIQRLTVDLESAAVRGGRLRRALLGAAFSGRLTGRATDMEIVEEMAGV